MNTELSLSRTENNYKTTLKKSLQTKIRRPLNKHMTCRRTPIGYFTRTSGRWVTPLNNATPPCAAATRIKTQRGMWECRSHMPPAWLAQTWLTVWPAEHRSKIHVSPLQVRLCSPAGTWCQRGADGTFISTSRVSPHQVSLADWTWHTSGSGRANMRRLWSFRLIWGAMWGYEPDASAKTLQQVWDLEENFGYLHR